MAPTVPTNVGEMAWAAAGPILTRAGYSGAVGLVAGAALKRVAQLMMVSLGLAFILLQILSHFHFITIHVDTIEKAATGAFDLTGDGKLDGEVRN